MQLLFAFTFNTETQEAVFSGNIDPQVALQIVQDIVVAEAVKNIRQKQEKPATVEEEKEVK